MGLDVSVYKNIKLEEPGEGILIEYLPEGREFFKVTVPHYLFLYKIRNLEVDRFYSGEHTSTEVSYSYRYHSSFREHLGEISKNRNGVLDGQVYNNQEPFWELIFFSDCEGCIDWEINTILYFDFLAYKEEAEKYFGKLFGNNSNYFKIYLNWLNVFEIAKDNGVVVFH
jgi:hypothetical protein